MDNYQYPIFFDCQGLDEKQLKKIQRYLCIRRNSGGGDCSPLRRVADNIYCTAFTQQRDQQAVLQRCQHTVEGLVLTVRDSLDPGCSTHVSASTASQSVTAAEQETFLPVQNKAEAARGSDSNILGFTGEVEELSEDAVRLALGQSTVGDKPQYTKNIAQTDPVSTSRRIMLLGKIGSGKSSTANTIFGERLFVIGHKATSGTRKCQAETKTVGEQSITLIDTPGFFDTDMPEEELRSEILRCITECAPGLHAFLIVLTVERYTEHEQAVITEICQCFSEDVLKYAVIVFTHGDQLDVGEEIEDFIRENEKLSELVKKCGGRCHVVDNKYWSNEAPDNYRSNQFQTRNILDTIDKLVTENNGGYFTNETLQKVEKDIQSEEECIRQFPGHMREEEIREQAKTIVQRRILIQLAGVGTGALLGVLFGAVMLFRSGMTLDATGVVNLGRAALEGGATGHAAAEGAETPLEATKNAAAAVFRQNLKH